MQGMEDYEECLKFLKPKRIFIEREALRYERARRIKEKFNNMSVSVKLIDSYQGLRGISVKSRREGYREAKRTLVIGVKRSKKFQTCKPSAHYQLPLATSCPGMCVYCYLNTNLGKTPCVRAYVNIDEILEVARNYIKQRSPAKTLFEGAATSDPLPVEDFTGNLKECINFFARESLGGFRFVTKFTNVDSLLGLNHEEKTKIRFSINTNFVLNRYEKNTPSLYRRLEAAAKIKNSGYPLGFLIAPIMNYPDWQQEYEELLKDLKKELGDDKITFELITHRYTTRAKNLINEVFPGNELPMLDEERQFKYGQFGYGKYVYPRETMSLMKNWFYEKIEKIFPKAKIEYFV